MKIISNREPVNKNGDEDKSSGNAAGDVHITLY